MAAEAGVGRATLYRHWPTVEDLLADVLLDCQAPLPTPEPSGDLRADLIAAVSAFVEPLNTSKLGEVLVVAMERAPADPRIAEMHEAMTAIGRKPLWDVVGAAISRGELDPGLTEASAAAYAIGPHLYQVLFDGATVTTADIERTVDIFLNGFATAR